MTQLLELPDFPDVTPAFPTNVATEQGFYSAAIKGDNVVEDAMTTSMDLEREGYSNLHTQAQELHMTEQDGLNRRVVADIVSDHTIPTEVRVGVMRDFLDNKELDHDIRNLYKQRTATIIPKDDLRTSEEMQAIVMSTLEERDKTAEELQDYITSIGAGFSGSVGSVVGGLARDVLPVSSAIVNAQSTALLRTLGFSELDITTGAAFIGSASKKIADKYKAAPLETKKAFVKEVFEVLSAMPGTDYNVFEKMRDMILDDNMADWEVVLENVGGALNLVGLGGIMLFPKRAIKDLFIRTRRPASGANSFTGPPDFTGPRQPAAGTSVAPREATLEGEFVPGPRRFGGRSAGDVEDADIIAEAVRPRVAPTGPMGTTNTANPAKAADVAETILEEAVTQGASPTARAMGTNPGEILADFVLPKIADLGTYFPSLEKSLDALDKRFAGLFEETRFNPAVGIPTQRTSELEQITEVFRSNKTATYQQANSIVHQGLFESNGTAVFGRNSNYGYSTREAAEGVKDAVQAPDGTTLRVFEKDSQWYIAADWTKKHDPLSDKVFGTDSVSAHFLGADVSGLARSIFGKYIWPSTMRLPEWVTKGAATTHMQVARIEREFADAAARSIAPMRNNKAFNNLLHETQEQGRYFSAREIVDMHPNLGKGELEDLAKGYMTFRRLAEYEFNWANRYDRKMKEAAGHEAIYVNDRLVGFGTRTFPKDDLDKAKYVYDFETDTVVPKTKEMKGTFVALEDPKWHGNRLTTFGFVAGKTRLAGLPYTTLNKIEGYIPRRNKERYYITSRYNEVYINGNKDIDTNKFSRVIAAESNKKVARETVRRLQEQYPDQIIDFKVDRGDTFDSIIVDHRLHKEQMLRSSTRGERLMTSDGPARLEDPFVELMRSIKATARLNMWSDYDQVFHKNFVKAFNEFLPEHAYPNDIRQIVLPKNASPEVTAKYRAALRLFENRRNQEFAHDATDEVFKTLLHPTADFAEKIHFKGLSDWLHDVASQGFTPIRAQKALNSVLFLHMNPLRQWIVQTQQLLEFGAMSPTVVPKLAQQIPALMMGINAQAAMALPYRKAMMALGQMTSGLSKVEYEAVVNAVVKSGLPESVDLNMMFHGIFNDVSRAMHETAGRQFVEGVKNFVKLPGRAGKAVGYGPSELANQLGGFIFARERWIKNNPGKNWNTPEHIQQIVGDGWDITHNMATRAAAMPYQDGAVSLLFQFVKVSHDAFMQPFSSKTLTGVEKAKVAAVRTALFGIAGVPAGFAIKELVHELNDPEVHRIFNEHKDGLTDWIVNNAIDAFMGEDGRKSNLDVSSALSPLPHTMPYLDFLIEMKNMINKEGPDPRFPFLHVLGSVGEALKDMISIFSVNEYTTEDALILVGKELAELTSGFNNAVKYMYYKMFGDKIDKLGRTYGLDVAEKNYFAQLFGIITKEEQALHEMNSLRFDEMNYVKEQAKSISEQLAKFAANGKIGTEDYHEYRRQVRTLLSFVTPELRDEIEREVDNMQRFSQESKMQNVYNYILEHHQDKNTKGVTNMIGQLEQLERDGNPQAKEFMRRLRREGAIQ